MCEEQCVYIELEAFTVVKNNVSILSLRPLLL